MRKRVVYYSPVSSSNRLFVSSIYAEGDSYYLKDDTSAMSDGPFGAVLPFYDLSTGLPETVLITREMFYEIKSKYEKKLIVHLNGVEKAELVESDDVTHRGNVYKPAPNTLMIESFKEGEPYS